MTELRRTAARLMFVTAAARLAVMALLPYGAISFDLQHWELVADLLVRGVNPYDATTYLNWPPFWMMVLGLLGRIDHLLSVLISVRLLLIAADCINVALALALAQRMGMNRPGRVLLIGFALNPIAILLTAEHGNFDALAVTSILSAILFLSRFHRRHEDADWLAACLALGIGILIKTFPLILAPFLIPGAMRLSRRTLVLGAMLLVLPAALPMGVLTLLAPDAVLRNVIRYHSIGGWFGISGLLAMTGSAVATSVHVAVFKIVTIATLIVLSIVLRRRDEVTMETFVLLASLLFTGVIVLGTGFGTQYAMWLLPLLPLCWHMGGGRWKALLVITYAVAAVMYVIEYALYPSHGAFLVAALDSAWPRQLADRLGTPSMTTLTRLPFLACLAAILVAKLTRAYTPSPSNK